MIAIFHVHMYTIHVITNFYGVQDYLMSYGKLRNAEVVVLLDFTSL